MCPISLLLAHALCNGLANGLVNGLVSGLRVQEVLEATLTRRGRRAALLQLPSGGRLTW